MTHAGHRHLLADLRRQVERLETGFRPDRGTLPFGVRAIDERLPAGGLALGSLHEFAGASEAFEHAAAPILFVAGILARFSGPVLWCLSRRDLFAPGLACAGLDPERVVYAETYHGGDVLPLMEEGLRLPGLAGVVGEVSQIGLTASRRLQLAAEASGVTAFLLRRWKAASEQSLHRPSAAVTRWRIAPAPSTGLATPGLGRARLRLDLLRSRGGEPHSWIVEAPDETGRIALSSDMADRPHQAEEWRRAATG